MKPSDNFVTAGGTIETVARHIVRCRVPCEEPAVMRALEAMGLRSWATDWRIEHVLDAMVDMRREMMETAR